MVLIFETESDKTLEKKNNNFDAERPKFFENLNGNEKRFNYNHLLNYVCPRNLKNP